MKKILLVDDSNTALMMEKLILKAGPYDLVTARDGIEGIDAAILEKPDLILMDLVMPRLDGLEACRQIRKTDSTRDIPVIMVTTRGEAATMEMAFRNGANDYVTKPFNGAELLLKVKQLIGA